MSKVSSIEESAKRFRALMAMKKKPQANATKPATKKGGK